jgi:hypothetical protein
VVIPQKALDSKTIRDAIKAMKTFDISAAEINLIVDGLSHSKPKPTHNNRRERGMSEADQIVAKNNFSVRLPRNVIVAKNEARKLATTMMAMEHGNAAHDIKETALMQKRTAKSRSMVRDLRAEDESMDSICHDRTAALLDARMQNLRNQANQLGLEIRNSEKEYDLKKRRNRIATNLAEAQKQSYAPKTMKVVTELVHGDRKKALLLVSMTPTKDILPIVTCYMKSQQAKEKSTMIRSYTPTLLHMLNNLTTEYHQGTLKTEALRQALEVVDARLKEFQLLSITMNHATTVGEERLDAINSGKSQK